MFCAALASVALLAGSAAAGSVGSARVVNNCDYDVHLCNVPASGGGYDQIDRTLKAGDQYVQQWTQLDNTMGWSIKLSKTEVLDHIMQYEYTWHGDDIIWYDLSCVDGNPWDGDYMITAKSDSGCHPRQAAYRYSTDDAYGMQSCPSDSTITVTLCSAENGTSPDAPSGGSDDSSSSQAPAYSAPASSKAPVSSEAPPAYSAPAASSAPAYSAPAASSYKPVNAAVVAPRPTTLQTVTKTEFTTIASTATAWGYSDGKGWYQADKRHSHHARRHAHN